MFALQRKSCKAICRMAGLVNDRAPGLVQVFLEIGHEGRAARSNSAGVAGMDLVLAMDVAVGVSDMDFAKLRQQIDAGAVGIPKFGIVRSPVADITREQRSAFLISRLLNREEKCPVLWRHVLPHFL